MGIFKDFFLRKKESQPPISQIPLPPIARLKPGGMIKILGYGLEIEDIDVAIAKKNMFAQGTSCWYQYQGDARNGTQVFLEVDMDDSLTLEVSLRRDLSLNDLNITRQQLKSIDDKESGSIVFEGNTFEYDDSDDAIFFRDCDQDYGRDLYYWEFFNQTLNLSIRIEFYEHGDDKITLFQPIREGQVEVIQLGG